jgi:pSer/pThr/pTyr-binding forkhead associated (FHA) protein
MLKPAKRPVPPHVTITLTDLAGRAAHVESLPFTVGRRESDLMIDHASVSGLHAVLDLVEGAIAVTDPGSTNGTSVNGFRIAKTTALKSGDEITFGTMPYTVKIVVAANAKAPAAQDPNATTMVTRAAPKILPIGEDRKVVLTVQFNGKQRQHMLDKRITTIGRVECDITVEDAALSRKHMQIEVYSDSFGLKDLASANGTFVNGKPISFLKTPGDVTFTAGSAVFHVFFEDTGL